MITRYREYLEFLDKELGKMFDDQSPYIKCKEGCAYCCKEGEYPMSELEYVNLMFAYNELENKIKDRVNENIALLLEKSREKMYECPFLVNGKCSVYQARGLICRAFGLITYDEKRKKRIPFCVDLGLNYSEVFNKDTRKVTQSSASGIEPKAFNVSRKFLRSTKIEKEFKIFFGEDKPLVEWLEEERAFQNKT